MFNNNIKILGVSLDRYLEMLVYNYNNKSIIKTKYVDAKINNKCRKKRNGKN